MHHHTISAGDAHPVARPASQENTGPAVPIRPESGTLDAKLLEADRIALALRAALERITIPLARAAQAFVRRKAWFPFGHARLADHARERFGRSGRWVCDQAALGRAMDSLPQLRDALTGDDGGRPIGTVAALHIGRVAAAASLPEWITLARSVPVRALRDAVRRARDARSNRPIEAGCDHGAGNIPPAIGATPPEERYAVRFELPRAVRIAFDETLDLYRAVVGSEATVPSFIEALVAESLAGVQGPEEILSPLQTGPDRAATEQALAVETGNWQQLPEVARSRREVLMARGTLALLDDLAGRAGWGEPEDLDAQLRELIALQTELECRLGALLATMSEQRAWRELRFAGVGHYGEERLGLSRTSTEDAARLARALLRFPHLRLAYRQGRVGSESARLVTRVLGCRAVPEDVEKAWVHRAQSVTIKRLRDEVRLMGRRTALAPEIRRSGPRPQRPWPPTDAEWHASLRRDAGLARRRVAQLGMESLEQLDPNVLLRNEPCNRGTRGVHERRPFPALITGRSPDREAILRLQLPSALAQDLAACVQACRGAVRVAVEHLPPEEPASKETLPPSHQAALFCRRRGRPLPLWIGLLAMLEEFVQVWDDPQSVAARHKRQVYARDGWRCTAPGCTSRKHLEDHHVHYRSHGGSDEASNRTCLCRFHHQRGEHGDLASCRGKAPLGLVWRLGRPGLASSFRSERRLSPSPFLPVHRRMAGSGKACP